MGSAPRDDGGAVLGTGERKRAAGEDAHAGHDATDDVKRARLE